MTFKNMMIAGCLLFAGLAVGLVLAPSLFCTLFGLPSDQSALVMARRAGVLMIGFSILTYVLRDLPANPLSHNVMKGFVVMLLLMAGLGIVELMSANVGAGILIAVVTEIAFALAFWTTRNDIA